MEKKDHVLLGAALTVGAVEGWLDEHVDPETGYVVDDTLAIEGAAADSKATGEAIAAVEAEIPAVDATLATTGAAADAKKTGDEIADLKSAVNYIYENKRTIPYTLNPGYINGTGGIAQPSSPNNEVHTDKIPASEGDLLYLNLVLKASNSMWLALANYDTNGDFISRVTIVNNVTQSSYSGTITIGSGVGFIALTYRTYTGAALAISEDWAIDGNGLADNTVGIQKFSSSVKENSRNLFNETWEHTYYDTSGSYLPNATPNCTACAPVIPVVGGAFYTVSWGAHDFTGSCRFYVHQFNSAKQRIKYDYFDYALGQKTLKLESNTAYVGLMQYAVTDIANWEQLIPEWTQVEAGTVATLYVDSIIVKNTRIDSKTIFDKILPDIKSTVFQNIPSNTVRSIAHRGDDIAAPQCTAPAYIIARKNGFSIAENDLWLSEDDEFVMWHDTSLNRLGDLVDINGYLMYTDGTDYYWVDQSDNAVYTWDGDDYEASATALSGLTRCAGGDYAVNSDGGKIGLNLDILKRIDFGVYKGAQFAGTQVLTLEEWVMLCKKLGMEIYIDKKLTYTNELLTAAANIVKKCGMGKYASWLGLYSVADIALLRSIIPDARVGILQHPSASYIESYASVNTGRGFFFNGDANDGLTKEVVQLGLNAGFDVESWYVEYGTATEEQILAKIQESVSFGLTAMTLDHYKVEDAFAGMLDMYS